MAKNQNIDQTSYESILKQASQQKGLIFRLSKTYPAYITLLLFLVLSYFVYNFFDAKVRDDRNNAFEKAVSSVMTRLDQKYLSNLQILNSVSGLYDNLIQVVRDYFMLYSQVPTQTYPSIISIQYIPFVKHIEKEDHIFNVQRQRLWDYIIKPAGERDYYLPIQFIEPFDKNTHKLGFDHSTNKMVNDVILKARDSNIIVSTPVFETRSDTAAFYIIAPVYMKGSPRSTLEERRANFNGVVLMEINSPVFFQQAIGPGNASDTSIVFQCFDIQDGKKNMIYESVNAGIIDDDFKPILDKDESLAIANRDILVKFATIPNFGGEFQSVLPYIALALSLLLSFVFFGFILSVSTSRARAIDLAERMTRSQRRIVESSKDIIAVLDMNGNWKSMNPASETIFGINPNEMIGSKIDPLFMDENNAEDFYQLFKTEADEVTERLDLQMKNKDGELKWLNWSFTVSKTDQLVYCIGRDVTLEKLAAEQARLRAKQIRLAEQFTREASEFKSYFMTKLSHQMRNNLTGVIGYLQLLKHKLYENEEEQDTYISLAEESSEELFTFMSDMVEVAMGSEDTKVDISLINLQNSLDDAVEKIAKEFSGRKIKLTMLEEGNKSPKVVADMNLLTDAVFELFRSLSEDIEICEIQIQASENPYEGATEIQILTNGNPLVSDMIKIFKDNSHNLIESLAKDKEDIIMHFAIAASKFRMLNGTMTLETFGHEDGNIVQLTLPLNKQQQA